MSTFELVVNGRPTALYLQGTRDEAYVWAVGKAWKHCHKCVTFREV